MQHHQPHLQLINDLASKAKQNPDGTATLQYPFPSTHAAQSFRFKFYQWRRRAKGVPLEAHHVTLSLSNNLLIAIYNPGAMLLPTPLDPFTKTTINDLPEHLRALVEKPLAGDVLDPANDAVRKLMKE